jgi:hypothetical protein
MAHKRSRGGARRGSLLGSKWVDQVRDGIPSVDEMVTAGISTLQAQGFNEGLARTEFGKWLVAGQKAIEEIHRKEEGKALERLVDLCLAGATPPATDGDIGTWARELLSRAAPEFVAFEFRAGQTRKSRAGSVWEKLGSLFLDWNGIPSEKPTGEAARSLRQIDKVVPSVRVALETPDRAIRLSFKTEAREKWRVLIDEGRRGHVYLVTLGVDITPARLEEMADSRLVAYVPLDVKTSRPEFQDNQAIRKLDDLPSDLRRYIPAGPAVPPDLVVKTHEVRDEFPESSRP